MDRKLNYQVSLLLAGVAIAGSPALAQRANENAVTSADDAFGTAVGNESIGLYSTGDVRGFSPTNAGNVRIEGVYIDRRGNLSDRLVSGSTIRVGLAAQGYPFPAPTGIADYHLRPVGSRALVSVVGGLREYGSPDIEVDAQLPIFGDTLGLVVGGSYQLQKKDDGTDGSYFDGAAMLRWRPAPGIEIIPFWSGQTGRSIEQGPTITSGGAWLPPRIPRRKYLGQDWVKFHNNDENTGLIVKARLGDDWTLSGGGFYSVHSNGGWFAQVFGNTMPDGTTNKRIIADPGQRNASKSGELRLSRTLHTGDFHHRIYASLRTRQLNSYYGGDAEPFVLGERDILDTTQVPYPGPFTFGPFTYDHVRQTTYGLAYEGLWRSFASFSLAMQRTNYRKTVELPDAAASENTSHLWLPSLSLALYPTDKLAFYADYTKGLEESGRPPNSAINRTEVMAAIQTKQVDAGLRWKFLPGATFVAGFFSIEKPYLNTDDRNLFMVLGNVRHRGYEFSLTANPVQNLNLVMGAVVMKPRVSGAAVDSGRVGNRPVGKPATTLKGNANYQLPFFPDLSFDLAVGWASERAATSDNLVFVPAYTVVDVGARYRFHIANAPATLRLQMQNLANTFAWSVSSSNSYDVIDGRRIIATVAADF